MNKTTVRIAQEFLDFLKDMGELAEEIALTPYGKLRLNPIPRTTYYYNLRRFQNQGYLKKERKRYASNFVLTAAGKELIRRNMPKTKRNDGFATFIIFDIPEEKSKERTVFRRYLIRNGYVQMQKSVLISPLKLSLEVKELLNELKIRKFVMIISGRIDHIQ